LPTSGTELASSLLMSRQSAPEILGLADDEEKEAGEAANVVDPSRDAAAAWSSRRFVRADCEWDGLECGIDNLAQIWCRQRAAGARLVSN
jgi:hypothetical protein